MVNSATDKLALLYLEFRKSGKMRHLTLTEVSHYLVMVELQFRRYIVTMTGSII